MQSYFWKIFVHLKTELSNFKFKNTIWLMSSRSLMKSLVFSSECLADLYIFTIESTPGKLFSRIRDHNSEVYFEMSFKRFQTSSAIFVILKMYTFNHAQCSTLLFTGRTERKSNSQDIKFNSWSSVASIICDDSISVPLLNRTPHVRLEWKQWDSIVADHLGWPRYDDSGWRSLFSMSHCT